MVNQLIIIFPNKKHHHSSGSAPIFQTIQFLASTRSRLGHIQPKPWEYLSPKSWMVMGKIWRIHLKMDGD